MASSISDHGPNTVPQSEHREGHSKVARLLGRYEELRIFGKFSDLNAKRVLYICAGP